MIKYKLIERYRSQARPAAGPPAGRPARPRLPRHPPRPRALLPAREARRGRPGDQRPAIFEAKSVPPQTTRARLRGEFIRRAQERRRDFTVDWVHLKLNDQAQRTVLCKDPFRSARRAGREADRRDVAAACAAAVHAAGESLAGSVRVAATRTPSHEVSLCVAVWLPACVLVLAPRRSRRLRFRLRRGQGSPATRSRGSP